MASLEDLYLMTDTSDFRERARMAERNYEWWGLEIKIQDFVYFSGKFHKKYFKA